MIRANHCSFLRCCIPTLLQLQLRFATFAGLLFGSCRPRYTCPWQYVTPTGHLTPVVISDLGNLPPLLPQSIIDRENRGIIRGFHPSQSSSQGDNCSGTARLLICKREKIQLTLLSHSRSYGLSYFTAQESLATLVISPRWTFQLQWDLHHTHTMVPLPTVLGQQPFWSKPLLHINYENRTFCF
jgi:hypothetical protein